MAEEKKTNKSVKSDNNMKFAVTIIIVLVALLAVAVFALQQKKNDGTVAESTSGSTVESTQDTSQDAGTVGKNEIKLTDANFKTEIEDYKGVALVDFYLSTCPHCQNVAKDVTTVSDELVGKAKVGKLESRESKTTSDKFAIEGVPTFIVFKDGVQVEKVSGEKTKDELLALVNKYLK